MLHRSRRLGAVVLSIACMSSVAACGSSSKSSSGSAGAAPAGRGAPAGFKLTTAQRSCLKKKGVTLPSGGFGGGRRGAGGSFPKGRFPKGAHTKRKFPAAANGKPPAGFAKQSRKRQAAFKACGVTFPSRPSQGGAPSSTTG